MVNHKKTNSVATVKYSVAAASSRSKPKTIKLQKANDNHIIDYNSVALDQILQQKLDTVGDFNYSTFYDGFATTENYIKPLAAGIGQSGHKNQLILSSNSSHKQRQKSTSKVSTSKSRQKNDLLKPININA